MTNPVVSAVITTYDRPDPCKRALRSVQAQTYKPLEVIVVEDGTDTDVEAWLSTEFPSAKYIRHAENRGLAAARNTGLERSTGDWVAYLDDDDEWKPERVERQIDKLRSLDPELRGDVGVVYCGNEVRTPEGRVLSKNHPQNSGELRASIQDIGASTLPSTFLFSRKALLDIGGFDESLPSSIDHDIWMSLATRGYHAATVDVPLAVTYESESESMVTDTYSRISGVKQYVRKWTPTFQRWYGVEAGIQYGERYYTRVIGRVVREKVGSGKLREAWHATRSILKFSSQYSYSAFYLIRTIKAGILDSLPQSKAKIIRQAQNTIKNKLAHTKFTSNK